MGFSPAPIDLEEKEMPDSFRNGLWNICSKYFFYNIYAYNNKLRKSNDFKMLSIEIWSEHFEDAIDTIPNYPADTLSKIREYFFGAAYWEVYNLIEFLAQFNKTYDWSTRYFKCNDFAKSCNGIFAREKSAFRFANCQLIKVTSETERREIEATTSQNISVGVREHISAAAEHYSRRDSPDYRNSIKESISAVESAVSHVLGRKSSGVKPLQSVSKELGLHPALTKGFISLYGYTSDAGGIRHALMDEPEITQEDAHYMLVSCAAFANYLLKLKSKG